MNPKLSIYQSGFCKQLSAQNCILVILQKLRSSLDIKGSTGIILKGLSKAYYCLVHNLLLAKLRIWAECNQTNLQLLEWKTSKS